MKTFTIDEAKQNLDRVLEEAKQGGAVYIEAQDNSLFELVLVAQNTRGAPKAGIMRGKVKIAADFNDPLPEFHAATK